MTSIRADGDPVVMDGFPLTPIQEGMLFHHVSDPHSGVDIEQIVCTLRHPVEPAVLEAAWARAASAHERLRTEFRWAGLPAPVQRTVEEVRLPFEVHDLTELGAAERTARFAAFLAEDRRRGFDLTRAPLARVTLFRFGDAVHRCVWTFPHILMDGRSFPFVLRDVFAAYDAGLAGAANELPGRPAFAGFVDWYGSRGGEAEEESYWRGVLDGFRAPTPIGDSSSAEASSATTPGTGASEPTRREIAVRVPARTTQALRTLSADGAIPLGTVLRGAWAILLSRHSGEDDVVFGATRACRRGSAPGAGDMVGVLINTVPTRARIDAERPVRAWLAELRAEELRSRPFEHAPLVKIRQWSDIPPGPPLFESLLVYDRARLDTAVRAEGVRSEGRTFTLHERTSFPLTLYAYGEDELFLTIAHDRARVDDERADGLLSRLTTLLEAIAESPEARVGELQVLPAAERRRLLEEWNDTDFPYDAVGTLHGRVVDALRREPARPALVGRGTEIPAGDVDRLSLALAHHLRARGAGRGSVVGVALPAGPDLVVALLAILRAGAAYLPLDPTYPPDRIELMLRDAGARLVVTTSALEAELPRSGAELVRVDALAAELAGGLTDGLAPRLADDPAADPDDGAGPRDLAYVIYTSGSTGRPKGVEVEHRNVLAFMAGMDGVLPDAEDDVWISLTSPSFDISVLEIFRPLLLGRKLVLHTGPGGDALVRGSEGERVAAVPEPRPMAFSLFYFASDEGHDPADRYRLLLEGAKFGDAHGFRAVWTPERHFHAFGGLYPNPAVAGAAIAAVTSRIQIRAGSVVLPLHHPIRVAEEWSVVDNLSGGRVGVSFASGWHPNDFVLAPERHADRREILARDTDVVRRLWRGERLPFPGPDGRDVEVGIMPRPVQGELPVWITTAGNEETYAQAGRLGTRVLTHLLGQSVDELAARIAVYRKAWRDAGHGPGEGEVCLMLHTFVGASDAEVKEIVREPMKAYLRSSVSLIRNFAASWTAYRRGPGAPAEARGDELDQLSPEDMDALLDYSFERYFEASGLFGSPETCLRTVDRLRSVGVDEIACLIDFGVDAERVLAHLPELAQVRDETNKVLINRQEIPELRSREGHPPDPDGDPWDSRGELHDIDVAAIADLVEEHGVTHLQCTPSRLRMILADPGERRALARLGTVMVGGEAFPGPLARALAEAGPARILNMYGPTETTIWSAVHEVAPEDREGIVPIGRPIANTRVYVLDGHGRPVPPGVPGELWIGGDGVVRGYRGRPELTAERFVRDPFRPGTGARLYRTGDRVRHRADGVLAFLGRTDLQVKLRGHRIELGEVEAALRGRPGVADVAVVLRGDGSPEGTLEAFLVPGAGTDGSDAWLRALRLHAEASLPRAMVPGRWTVLERLPLTPNQKVDRAALLQAHASANGDGADPSGTAAPTVSADAGIGRDEKATRSHGGAARAEAEDVVAAIWRDLLGLSEIRLDDNFFDLGGHSLLTVQVHGRLREAFGLELRILDLFRHPTVRTLAAFLARDVTSPSPAESVPESAPGNAVESARDRGAQRRRALEGRTRGTRDS